MAKTLSLTLAAGLATGALFTGAAPAEAASLPSGQACVSAGKAFLAAFDADVKNAPQVKAARKARTIQEDYLKRGKLTAKQKQQLSAAIKANKAIEARQAALEKKLHPVIQANGNFLVKCKAVKDPAWLSYKEAAMAKLNARFSKNYATAQKLYGLQGVAEGAAADAVAKKAPLATQYKLKMKAQQAEAKTLQYSIPAMSAWFEGLVLNGSGLQENHI